MKTVLYAVFVFVSLAFVGWNVRSKQPVAKPKIIFDTDMGPDYDDVGAITVLHALAAKGECEILATVSSDGHPSIAPTIQLFNEYFRRPDIPVGVPSAQAPNFTAPNHWNDSLITRFSKQKIGRDYPKALNVYRELLSKQEDNSVTIVTVGFLSNLKDLLNSKPDQFSSLSGIDLVKKKVKNWVAMAGGFPEGSEFNVNKHPEASYEVFRKWPKPILFSGYEIGERIRTGAKAAKKDTKQSPVAWAYQYNLRSYVKAPEISRSSWDQTAVLCAVRDPKKYFYVTGPGKFIINQDGSNLWDPDTDAGHYFLTHKYPFQKISDLIDDLMLFEPK